MPCLRARDISFLEKKKKIRIFVITPLDAQSNDGYGPLAISLNSGSIGLLFIA